ncbi:hypothetical protein GUJ93_ZPchr0013g35995 [Zizania palustris]|uniref:Uncharacterized protein n=1 Tax=Zizania palustris TaxID=103762 RepID=A0A8J5X1X3_ZIZPA|nr:hypothetical protein GUJ93_ZPchr0013g35995 [Zizania palustris]
MPARVAKIAERAATPGTARTHRERERSGSHRLSRRRRRRRPSSGKRSPVNPAGLDLIWIWIWIIPSWEMR